MRNGSPLLLAASVFMTINLALLFTHICWAVIPKFPRRHPHQGLPLCMHSLLYLPLNADACLFVKRHRKRSASLMVSPITDEESVEWVPCIFCLSAFIPNSCVTACCPVLPSQFGFRMQPHSRGYWKNQRWSFPCECSSLILIIEIDTSAEANQPTNQARLSQFMRAGATMKYLQSTCIDHLYYLFFTLMVCNCIVRLPFSRLQRSLLNLFQSMTITVVIWALLLRQTQMAPLRRNGICFMQ